ncbi:MAG: ComEA family DNA-binding protein [Thermodesulfobacteriota bacterium]
MRDQPLLFHHPIDINRADALLLQQLPGIGPQLSGRIIAWRQEHGNFSELSDLQRVKGIGPATLARLRAQICVSEP